MYIYIYWNFAILGLSVHNLLQGELNAADRDARFSGGRIISFECCRERCQIFWLQNYFVWMLQREMSDFLVTELFRLNASEKDARFSGCRTISFKCCRERCQIFWLQNYFIWMLQRQIPGFLVAELFRLNANERDARFSGGRIPST